MCSSCPRGHFPLTTRRHSVTFVCQVITPENRGGNSVCLKCDPGMSILFYPLLFHISPFSLVFAKPKQARIHPQILQSNANHVRTDSSRQRTDRKHARHVPWECNLTKTLGVRSAIRFLRVNSESERLVRPTRTLRVVQPSARHVPRESTPTPGHRNVSSVTLCIVFPNIAMFPLLACC